MKKDLLDDTYDIVKQSFLCCLGGEWNVHPMLTEEVDDQWTNAYKAVLGGVKTTIISTPVPFRKRGCNWYTVCNVHGNLFLDPHTGLILENGSKDSDRLAADELVNIVRLPKRKGFLTMVFDQSINRNAGSPKMQIQDKLNYLNAKDVYAFAYVSHSCVVVASDNDEVTRNALNKVLANSGLPGERFIKF